MEKEMNIEYEALFVDIKKDEIRRRLQSAGAKITKPEFLQKRTAFSLPGNKDSQSTWLRVRDEGDKVTMSIKKLQGRQIHDQQEICLTIDSYDGAVDLLMAMDCRKKAYQESKRELWVLDGVEITIDEWPFLEPFVEVEGKSEQEVKAVSEKIGFDWRQARFCAVGTLYEEKYGVSLDEINNNTPRIVFGEKNPFLRSNY
jgi:adenylate cyclase class 2